MKVCMLVKIINSNCDYEPYFKVIGIGYTKVFNSKAFKKDHADLYEQYRTLEKYTSAYFKVIAKDIDRCHELAEQ